MTINPWEYRTILITGGTGSFGTYAVRACLDGGASKVIVFSRDEVKQAALAERFAGETRMRYFLGDIRDVDRLTLAFRDVDVVLHAAALKRVVEGEYNPSEFIRTNVDGTLNVVRAALACEVERVCLLSTDKACQPINLYGTTKLCAEKVMQAAGAYVGTRATRFCAVRYGNVLGSRGSVIPFWRAAQAEGKSLPVTDPAMTRFWITLSDAFTLVQNAVAHTQGGEVFIPKLSAASMMDVAHAMCPTDAEARITVIGPRPGEKRHEILIGPEEAATDVGWAYALPSVRSTEPKGTPMEQGFQFRSLSAPRLTVPQLRSLLATL